MPEIVVVMHSNSAVAFRPGQALALADVRCPAGRVQVTYRTNWVSTREKVDIPNTLEIEIAGEAANLETALSPFGNAGLCGVVALSLAANAGIDEPSIELGFDRTPGKTQRDFFQAYVPPREPVLRSVRFLDREATADLLGAGYGISFGIKPSVPCSKPVQTGACILALRKRVSVGGSSLDGS